MLVLTEMSGGKKKKNNNNVGLTTAWGGIQTKDHAQGRVVAS